MSDSDQGARVLEEIVTASVEGLGLAATVVVEDGPEGGLIARITGDDVDVLVERNGEVLDAVQSLAAQAVRRLVAQAGLIPLVRQRQPIRQVVAAVRQAVELG